jgi:hypothetical protein
MNINLHIGYTKERGDDTMRDLNNLKNNLDKLLNANLTNRELSKLLTSEVYQKNLPSNLSGALFNKAKEIIDCNEKELICLSSVFYKYFKNEEVNPKQYFSQQQIVNYYNDIREEKEEVDTLEFKDCIQINDTSYIAFADAESLYNYYVNNLIIYNKSTQRASRIRVLGSGYVVKEISVNKNAVKEIANEMLNHTYESDMIIFNVVQIPNKILNVNYENRILSIKPNLDLQDEDTTIVNVVDGYHRLSAIVRAAEKCKKENKTIPKDMGLIVKIVIRDIIGAKRIVSQSFKRSATNKDFLKSLEVSDYSKLADAFISRCDILRDNVYDTYEECLIQKGYTYKVLLTDTIKMIIDKDKVYLNNLSMINKMADIFNQMIEYIYNEYYSNLGACRNDSNLLKVNSFAYWLVYLYGIVEANIQEEDLLLVTDKVMITSSEWFDLDKRRISLKEIIEAAKQLTKEVLKDV